MRRLSFCFKFVKDSFRGLNVCFLYYFDFNKFNRTVNMTIIQYNYLLLQRKKFVFLKQLPVDKSFVEKGE